jgi:hypothetical protein
VVVVCLLWIGAVFAGEPEVVVLSDGTVRGVLEMAAPPETIRALVTDPVALRRATQAAGQASAQPDGSCMIVASVGPQASYTSRSCPTADGWVETLVSSEQMSAFSARWRVEPTATGSRVSYELAVTPTLPVPAMIVRTTLKSSVRDVLRKVGAHFSAP